MNLNRREWMAGASALGLASLSLGAGFTKPLGVQLYTVRSIIGKAEEETLKRIADIGYREVETTGRDKLEVIAPYLQKDGLKAVSSHMDIPAVTGATAGKPSDALMQAIEGAKKHGVQYLVFPYLPPSERKDAAGYQALAEKLNTAGKACKSAGLTLCYHNHAFEFGGEKGQRPIDVLNASLDKSLVFFELDLFWVSVAGNDPVAILKEFKGRAPLVHLKDKMTGAPVQFNEGVSKETFKEVGSGSLDFPAILKTAASTGVKHYFVEQDQTPGDPVDSLKKSYEYLRSVKL